MSLLQWENLSAAEKQAIKLLCEESLIAFIRIFFQLLQGQRFHRNWHHGFFCDLLEDVYSGYYNRLIINCPPGATKTEIVSIHWAAWCIIQCIKEGRPTRWLPISYSADLVDENASRLKEILESDEFTELWPLTISSDKRAKNNWQFEDANGNTHRMFGTSLMGQLTGRRAGYMLDPDDDGFVGFTGALMLDDPLPPREEGYGRKIEKYNKFLNRVVRSRLAVDTIPIVMIQQRIAKNDSTAFLMSDKAPDQYIRFKVPAVVNGEYIETLSEDLKAELIESAGFTGEPVSYWEDKDPLKTLKAFEKADPYLYHSQYQQEPDDAFLEGVIFRNEIDLLIAEGRLRTIPIEPRLPAYTFWDIGINDDMAIWVMQPYRNELRMVWAYRNNDTGIEHYINKLLDLKEKYGIRFEKHYAPHDINKRNPMTGKTDIVTAREMGIRFTRVPRCGRKRESLAALRKLFPRIHLDPVRCKKGWEGIKKYRREWDPDNEVFSDNPVKDWTTHYADALQQMGLAWKDPEQEENNVIPFAPADPGMGY